MRKIIVSALILFVLIGLVLPASAGADDHKKSFDKDKKDKKDKKYEKPQHKEFKVDKDTNTAIVTQTQIAVPISFDNKNTAWFGDAGTQSTYQS